MAAGRILVPKETGLIIWNGERHVVRAGQTRIREGHPMLECAGDIEFEPVGADFELPEVEDTRKSPSTPTSKPRKRAAAKPKASS